MADEMKENIRSSIKPSIDDYFKSLVKLRNQDSSEEEEKNEVSNYTQSDISCIRRRCR